MKNAKQTLRRFTVLVAATFLNGAVPSAFAKAYYAPEDEMISRVEVIAIVDISSVEKSTTKGVHWTYGEIAHATVQQALKGKLPQSVKLHGGESFICAQVHFAPGRYLVFLSRDGELFVGCNWHFSVRPIKEAQVEWYSSDESLQLSWQRLFPVIERIKNSTAKPKEK